MFGTKGMTPCAQALGMMVPILLTLAAVVTITGVAFPYWVTYQGVDYGIFEICKADYSTCSLSIVELETSSSGNTSIWKAMIVLAVVGSLFLFIAELMVIIYPFKREITYSKLAIGLTGSAMTILGAIFIICVVGIMLGSAMDDIWTSFDLNYVGWSLYLAFSGAVLGIVTGIFFAIHLFMITYY